MEMAEMQKTLIEGLKKAMEPTELRDMVAEWVKKNQGKMIRANNVPEQGKISKRYGMTDLVFPNDIMGDRYSSVCFTLAHSVKNVSMPSVDDFLYMNSWAYAGIDERNRERQKLIVEIEMGYKIAREITEYVEMVQKVRELRKSIDETIDYRIYADVCKIIPEMRVKWR